MAADIRLKTTGRVAFAVLLFGIGVLEALARFGASPVLAVLLVVLPLAIAMVVAIRMRSLVFSDVLAGGSIAGSALSWAIAGALLPSTALVAAPIAVALGGWSGIVLILALGLGLAVGLFLVLPGLRSTAAPTLAAAIGQRFGRTARGLAAGAIVLILLPLIVAEASLLGTIASRMLGFPAPAASEILLGLAVLAALFGGVRAAIAMAAVTTPLVALAYFTPVSLASLAESGLPLPWNGLFKGAAYQTATSIPAPMLIALAVTLILGIATLPTVFFPAWLGAREKAGTRHFVLALLALAAILLAAPSYAVFGQAHGIDVTTNPSGLVLNFVEHLDLSAVPLVLLIGGLLTAGLVTLTLQLAILGAAIGHDLYGTYIERRAPLSRRVFMARLAMLLAAGLAASLQPAAVTVSAVAGLSIGAATLGPILLVGWRLRAVDALPAALAMITGFLFFLFNAGLASFAPAFAEHYLLMPSVSPTLLGPTGWFGLPIGVAGCIGALIGLVVMGLVAWLEKVQWSLLRFKLRWLARRFYRKLTPKRSKPKALTSL